MLVHEKTLTFDKTLWVRYGAVDVQQHGDTVTIAGRDDDSYVKVFNHFGRVLKLFTYESGRWVDADTGMAAEAFDDSQAGRLPEEVVAVRTAAAAKVPAGQKAAAPPARRTAAAKPKPGATRKAPRPSRSGSASARQARAPKARATKARATKDMGAGRRGVARNAKGGLKRASRG